MSKRFRYALEPLRLTRRWELDALLTGLADCHAQVRAQQQALDALDESLAQARGHWLAGQAEGSVLALESLALLGRYLNDGVARRHDLAQALAKLEAERDAAAQRAAQAQRALDAVEDHRDECHAGYRRMRAGGDLKLADEHWNVMQAKGREHELDG